MNLNEGAGGGGDDSDSDGGDSGGGRGGDGCNPEVYHRYGEKMAMSCLPREAPDDVAVVV